MFLEATRSYVLQNTKQGRADVFIGKIERSLVQLMYLGVKKAKSKEGLMYLHVKMHKQCTREVFIRGWDKKVSIN